MSKATTEPAGPVEPARRPATASDAYMQEFAADLKQCRANELTKYGGDSDEADRLAVEAKRHQRSAWMIRRHLNWRQHAPAAPAPDVSRPSAVATPRERKYRRSSSPSRAGPSDDEGPSDEPPPAGGRLCENTRCEKDISHRPGLALYCNDACQQAAWRDRQTVAHLDELVGTVALGLSCTCSPKRNFVIGGVCHQCGRPRGEVTRDWLDSDMQARSFVSTRTQARKPRLGDGKRHPKRAFVDESIIRVAA